MKTSSVAQTLSDSTRQSVSSPDNNYRFIFYQQRTAEGKKQMYYELTYKGKAVINQSELGILVNNNLYESALNIPNDSSKLWCENLDLINTVRTSANEIWKPVYGERNTIPDHYNEMTVQFEKFGQASQLINNHDPSAYDPRRTFIMHIVVRAYNEGVAFRYYFPENEHGLFVHIDGEQTQFSMPAGTMAYYERWAEAPYQYLPLKNWTDECERPLTMKLKNGLTVALTEAMMVDYARTKFRLDNKKPETLQAAMYGNVDITTPYETPWRVIMAADTPGKLIENNYLILNLNPANKIKDLSWIRPGKVFRSGLTTKEALESVDFASSRNLQYVHLDAGWYGNQWHVSADAGKAVSPADLDLQKLIAYGASKNIGILLYVNQRALTLQIDSIFPLYQRWGIKGVKFGFVHTGSQYWSVWLHNAVKKAAEHKLMVDIHDEYRPTGFSRTYPNLMTQEGIRGNEEMPDATHTTILPFTRYLAGAGDNTICYYNNRIKTTHAHQLAMSVISYSPLQYMYWYDKPSFYENEPEVDFFDRVKTVWDETRVISGEPGEHIAMARRSGEEWFIGILTNNDSRKLTLPLNFIDKDKKYIASIYTDDDKIKTKTKVKAQKFIVDTKNTMSFFLKASGGAAIHLLPASDAEIKMFKKLPKEVF